MKNLFENAYFGKAYKTRSGQKAIYLFSSGCGVYCITEEFKHTIRYYSIDGIPYDFECSRFRGEDIVSEWQEPIDEVKLSELAWKYTESLDIPCRYEETALESFKAGYKKAKHE